MSLDAAVLDTLLHDPARLTAGQRAEIARRLAMPVGWTREATEQLAALWQTGASGSLIAAAINRDHGTAFSRNAVIGKVHRLKLNVVHPRAQATSAGRVGKAERAQRSEACPRVQPRGRPRGRAIVPTIARDGAESIQQSRPGYEGRAFPSPLLRLAHPTADITDRVAVDAIAPPVGRRCSLLELDDATCRWPVGDPRTPEFYFCGGKPLAGRPYCAYHAALAYQPETDR
jgi:GcrA cell cycle regulator